MESGTLNILGASLTSYFASEISHVLLKHAGITGRLLCSLTQLSVDAEALNSGPYTCAARSSLDEPALEVFLFLLLGCNFQ